MYQELNMQKGFAGIIILIIALILAGLAGAYYFGKIQNPKTQVMQPTIAPSSSSNETVYTEASRSANWKTYTNPKYSFSLKYPEEWNSYTGFAWDNLPQDDSTHVDLTPDQPLSSPGGGVPTGVRIFVIDNKDNLSALEYAKKQAIDPSSAYSETINNVQIAKTSGIATAGNGGPASFIVVGNSIIEIIAEFLDKATYDKIISTFTIYHQY